MEKSFFSHYLFEKITWVVIIGTMGLVAVVLFVHPLFLAYVYPIVIILAILQWILILILIAVQSITIAGFLNQERDKKQLLKKFFGKDGTCSICLF